MADWLLRSEDFDIFLLKVWRYGDWRESVWRERGLINEGLMSEVEMEVAETKAESLKSSVPGNPSLVPFEDNLSCLT